MDSSVGVAITLVVGVLAVLIAGLLGNSGGYAFARQEIYEDCVNFGAFEYDGEIIKCEVLK